MANDATSNTLTPPTNLEKLVANTRIYLGLMAFLYICIFVGAALGGLLSMQDTKSKDPTTPLEYALLMGFFSIIMIPLIAVFLYSLINIYKPKKSVYYVVLIAIVIGFDSIITILPTIYLFVKWIDNDVKDYYLGKKTNTTINN